MTMAANPRPPQGATYVDRRCYRADGHAKAHYRNRGEARFAARTNRHAGSPLEIYACPEGRGYHLGHQPR